MLINVLSYKKKLIYLFFYFLQKAFRLFLVFNNYKLKKKFRVKKENEENNISLINIRVKLLFYLYIYSNKKQ